MRLKASIGVLRHRDFRYQFAGYSISVTGSMLSPVAVTLGLLQVTGSASTAGIALTASTVPLAIFLLFGGVLADRLPRNLVMVTADSIRGLTQLGVGWMLFTGHVDLLALVLLQAVFGTAQAFHLPAASGLTASTVPKAHLQQANALLSAVRSMSGVLGPLIAGVLVATVGAGWAMFGDGVSFLLSALLVSRIKLADRAARPNAERAGVFRELADGFGYVRRTPWVWTSITGFATTHIALAAFLIIGPLVAVTDGGGALGWAAVIAALGVGELIGDAIAMRYRPGRPMIAARVAELLFAPALVAVGLAAPMPVQLAAVVVAGAGMSLADTLWYTAMQQRVPAGSLSKVSSYDWLGSVVLRPVGYSAGAAFAAAASGAAVLVAGAVLVVAARVVSLAYPSVRAMRAIQDDEPEPVAAVGPEQGAKAA